MKLLLDTHVFLWWCDDDPRLLEEPRRAVRGAEIVYVSAASAWEAAIKMALGKLSMEVPFERAVELHGFDKLPITLTHAGAVTGLARHHGDPFDRMLVAQALTERATVVTHDRRLAPYGVPILWA